MRVPTDGWYLPVTRAVASEIAAAAGFSEDRICDALAVTTEVATALCTDSEPGAVAELTFRQSPRGLRIVGKARTRQAAPPDESTARMRSLRQLADEVAAVCVVDAPGRQSLRLAATICLR